MAGIGPYDFNRILKGKKKILTFFPSIDISMNWRHFSSSQVRDYHRTQTDPSLVFDIQCRLMGGNTQAEPNFSYPSVPWEEQMTEQPGCYGHHHSGLTVSQAFTAVQMQRLQPLLRWGTLPHAWSTSYTWSKQWCLVTGLVRQHRPVSVMGHMLLQQLQTVARTKIRIESLHKKAVETTYLQHTWIDSLALPREQWGFKPLFQERIEYFHLLDSAVINQHIGLQLYEEPQSQ